MRCINFSWNDILQNKHDLCNTQAKPLPLYLDDLRVVVEDGARCDLSFERDGDDAQEMTWWGRHGYHWRRTFAASNNTQCEESRLIGSYINATCCPCSLFIIHPSTLCLKTRRAGIRAFMEFCLVGLLILLYYYSKTKNMYGVTKVYVYLFTSLLLSTCCL